MPAALLALLPILGEIAPWIIRQLAGDGAGAVAEQVLAAAGAVAGGTDPATVAAAVADPARRAELALELGKISATAEAERERQATERWRLELEGVANARAAGLGSAEIARTQSRMAWAVLVLFAAVLAGLFLRGVPAGAESLVNVLLGVLTAGFAAVIGYYFGSSAGSAAKERAMSAALGGAPPPFPVPTGGRR